MIRWIRARLGTGPYDGVRDAAFTVIDVRHLVDKGGNAQEAITTLIDIGANAWKRGETVVVACDFGVSRSNAIAAGILSRVEDTSYDDALREVASVTGESEIKLDVVMEVRNAVGFDATIGRADGVLVTGGSGFLGRALNGALSGERRTLAPNRATLDLESGAVLLADYCRHERVGSIVHLAYPRTYTNPAATGTSLAILRSVLDACVALDIRLVFVSGTVVFGGYATSAMLANESTPINPKGIYGENKALEEQLLAFYARNNRLRYVLCRLAPVYGPGGDRPRLIKAFYQHMKTGEPVTTHLYRNGRPALDLIYVDDAARALRIALESRTNGILHFGSGTLTSTRDLAAIIAKISNATPSYAEIAINDVTSNVALDASVATALGWSPQVGIEDGMLRTIASFRDV